MSSPDFYYEIAMVSMEDYFLGKLLRWVLEKLSLRHVHLGKTLMWSE